MPHGVYYWRVVRNGEVGNILTIVSNKFTVSPVASRAPRLTGPSNNAFINTLDLTDGQFNLSWDWGTLPAPAGTFTYDLEGSTSSAFDINLTLNEQTSYQAFTVFADLYPDATYYWRVRAVNSVGVKGAWSSPFKFVLDRVPLGAPSILTPIIGADPLAARPTFTWTPVNGAVGYDIKLLTDPTCTSGTIYHQSSMIKTTSYTLPLTASALPQDLIFACVRSYDANLNPSAFSSARGFTVSLLASPVGYTVVPFSATTRPTFKWNATPGITNEVITYRVEVEDDTSFDGDMSYVYVSLPLTASAVSFDMPTTQALPKGKYYWRVVRTVNGVDQSVPNGVQAYRSFYVGALGAAPVLTLPANGSITDSTHLSLTWNQPVDADFVIENYQLEISKSPTFATVVSRISPYSPGSMGLYYFDTNTPNNHVTYYWRVRGWRLGSALSAWSSTGSFIIDTVAPDTPKFITPVSNSVVGLQRPVISWKAVPGAVSYKLYLYDLSTNTNVDLDSNSANVYASINAPLATFTPPLNLPQSSFIMSLQANDGVNTSNTQELYFSVRLGTLPAINSTVTTHRPTFTWTPALGATLYTLDIDDDPTFEDDGVNGDATILYTTGLTLSTTSYLLPEADSLPTGVYYWRISHNGPNGGAPANYGGRMLSIISTHKVQNLVSRNRLGQTDTLINANDDEDLSFTWNAVLPAPTYYQVEFSRSSAFGDSISYLSGSNSLTVSTFSEQGTWYWHVRTANDSTRGHVGPWSETRSFTYDIDPLVAPPFSCPTPFQVNTARPTFKWVAPDYTDIAKYHFTVIDNETAAPVPSLNDLKVTGLSYTVPATTALRQNTLGYTLDLETEDKVGNVSDTFTPCVFTVFVPKTPLASEVTADTTPLFTWTGVTGTGAGLWTLQISTMSDMSSILYISPLLPATAVSFTLPNAKALTTQSTYYWRVFRVGETASIIPGRPFSVVNSLASITPALLTVPNGDLINGAEQSAGWTLSWSDISAAVPAGVDFDGYYLEVNESPTFAFASMENDYIVMGTSDVWTGLDGGDSTYYWRVRASFNNESFYGPASAVYKFTVDTHAPSMPTLNTRNNAVFTTRTPTLTWTAASGTPTQYIVEFANEDNFNDILFTQVINAPATSLTLPPSMALPNGGYNWRVTARDAAGNPVSIPHNTTGAPTTTPSRHFTIAAP